MLNVNTKKLRFLRWVAWIVNDYGLVTYAYGWDETAAVEKILNERGTKLTTEHAIEAFYKKIGAPVYDHHKKPGTAW